jgi:flagellar biosynthesis component FlhA
MQALLADELQVELKERYGHRKWEYKVNLATAIGHLKKNIDALFTAQETKQILQELKESFLRHVEPIRPNRKYPRQKDKYLHRKKPILMKNRRNVL